MEPKNYHMDPYVYGIGTIAEVPAFLFQLIVIYYKQQLPTIAVVLLVTIPYLASYYLLWKLYKKSKYYQKRYGVS